MARAHMVSSASRHDTPRTVLFSAWAPFFSGAERALLVLIDNLDRRRYRPVVAIGVDGELAEQLRARNVTTYHCPIVYRDRRAMVSWATTVARLAWLAHQERASIVHANDVPSFQPAGYAARMTRIPAVTHVRFPDTGSGFGWFLKPGFGRALFVSKALLEDAQSQASGLFDGRSEVVYDGVHIPPLESNDTRLALRRELDLPLDRTLVVMAGQVAEVKGIWDFIEAARVLHGRGVPVSFIVLGDDLKNKGAVRIEAERRVREQGLGSVFHFLGFRPNAQRLIPAFDIVAVPSHVEPLGNATLEAMASARPVIGSRVGGIPEMVVDHVTGVLVGSKAPLELAAAIERLARDPEWACVLGAAGRQRALDHFGIQRHVEQVMAVYDRFFQ